MKTTVLLALCALAVIDGVFASPLADETGGYFAKRERRAASGNPDDYMAKRVKRSSEACTEKYQSLPASTMCEYSRNDSATDEGVTYDQIVAIVDAHNAYRRQASPTPSNMQKIYWDQAIADIAQHYASHCPDLIHDLNHERWVPGYGISIGQNLCLSHPTWQLCIDDWHDEETDYHYGQLPGSGVVVGHYTQMMMASSSSIGCGYAKCYGRPQYVCNYAYGQTDEMKAQPYRNGTKTCAECENSCENDLCDCLGWICMNGGTLNQDTCTCSCPAMYTGSACHVVNCPPRDDPACALYVENECTEARIYNKCPVLCGRCEARCPSMSVDVCKNGGSLNWDTCSCVCASGWSGPTCEEQKVSCKTDEDYCVSYASWCWDSFVKSNCPNTCGLC